MVTFSKRNCPLVLIMDTWLCKILFLNKINFIWLFFSEWHCVYILSSSVKRWTRSAESQVECHQTERYLDQNIGLNKIMIQWRHQYFINSSYTDKFNIFSAIIKFIFFLNFFFFKIWKIDDFQRTRWSWCSRPHSLEWWSCPFTTGETRCTSW